MPDGHFAYAHLLNNLGRFDEALAQARQARELDPLSPLVNVLEAGFLAAAGRLQDYVPGASRAAISNALDGSDEALGLLELAYDQRDVRMTFLKINACWNNLRTQPRFEALMERMGFAAGAARWVL